MTHDDLIERGEGWLKQAKIYHPLVLRVQRTKRAPDLPDLLGWSPSGHSIALECVTGRDDFAARRGYAHAWSSTAGVGNQRFYLAPAGLLVPGDIPAGWGLLEVRGVVLKAVVAADDRKAKNRMMENRLLVEHLLKAGATTEPDESCYTLAGQRQELLRLARQVEGLSEDDRAWLLEELREALGVRAVIPLAAFRDERLSAESQQRLVEMIQEDAE